MKPDLRIINKFYASLLISLTVLVIMGFIYFRITYLKKQKMEYFDNFEDDDDDIIMYYEYMGDVVAHQIKKIDDIEHLKRKIRKVNKDQHIHYQDEYHTLFPLTSVVVIQIHHEVDVEFLKALLYGLKYLTAVKKSLVIFSHDNYDDEINELIREAGFAIYIQIYYPYSTQLFPESFPGRDFQLCTNNFQCERSALRYEPFAQKKHYWWWQMHYIFDELNAIKDYNRTVIFLEADQFVLSDFIYVNKIIELLIEKKCPDCEIISLGAHTPDLSQYHGNNVNVTISSWDLDVSSVGIAFNRTVWIGIKNYSSLFCNYNDYRWDASLRHLGLKRDKGQFKFLLVDAPRVIKHRKCEGYVGCSPERQIEDAANFIQAITSRKALFPENINLKKPKFKKESVKEKKQKEIGGWEDDRDKGLCMYFVER